MECVVAVILALMLSCSILTKAMMVTNRFEPTSTVRWEDSVKEVNNNSSLAQVLGEYLADIELVELAASKCADAHRQKYLEASGALQTALDSCLGTSNNQRDVLAQCIEEKTTRVISDVRQNINALKECVDSV